MITYTETRTGTAEESRSDHTIIVLHGYGANEQDLLPIAEIMGGAFRWVFPRAPLPIYQNGYAWFPRNENSEADFSLADGPELQEAGAMLCELITGLASETYILAGFSQGAMVAIETALQMPMPPQCMCIFSSALIARERWNESLHKLDLLPVFQSHGFQDPVLSFSGAEALHTLLSKHCNVCFQSFYGGHELPTSILKQAGKWLAVNS